MEHLVVLLASAVTLDCQLAVPKPTDTAPERSPQAVHTSLLNEFRGRDLAEIGTRHGDGMRCFAQVARRAAAFEFDARYCGALRKYGAMLNFSAVCGDYKNASVASLLDADYITWWQQAPMLSNADVLWHLRDLQRKGTIRDSALAGGRTHHSTSASAREPLRNSPCFT